MTYTMNVSLNEGTINEGDLVLVVRQSNGKPKLAARAVAPGGTIHYEDTNGDPLTGGLNFSNHDSPFTQPGEPNGQYHIKSANQLVQHNHALAENHAYVYHVGGTAGPYTIYVHQNGQSSAQFVWNGSKLKVKGTVNLDQGQKIVFIRGEEGDTPVLGDILIQADFTYKNNLANKPRVNLHIPSSNANGVWTGDNGSYNLTILQPTVRRQGVQTFTQEEETGSDEGDIILDPPPPFP